MPLRRAITGDYAKEILREHGFTPNPEPYVSPMPIEENERQAWFDVNAGAVRLGDVMPDYPIRILFDKVQHPMYVDYIPAGVRELTAEEAKDSKALSREPWDTKVSPWPPRSLADKK